MKSLRNRRMARVLAPVLSVLAVCSNLLAADAQVVPARPGARVARPFPEAVDGAIRLSLNEAIALALSNNSDLNVSVNTAEATRYGLMISKGIFDPVFTGSAIRAHRESPATSTLVGAAVNRVETFDAQGQLQQLLPVGGLVTLGYAANRTASNSTFSFVNPSFASNITLSVSQPLLRGFGLGPTYWQIKIARNSQDSAYLDFLRSVQSVVNTVEQAYWDLVYAIQNLDVKRESLRIAQDLNRITRIKIDVGSLAPIDIVQTEVGIAQAEQDIITAEGLIGDAQDRLKRVMSFDPARWSSAPIAPTDKVQAEEMAAGINVEDATRVALEKRPDVKQALYQAQSDQIRFAYWHNEALPGLNLIGSYGNPGVGGSVTFIDANGNRVHVPGDFGNAFNNMTSAKNKNWSFGLQLSYPILNRAGRGQLGAAHYIYEASKARLTTTEQNVQVDVRSAARAIDTSIKSIAAARKGRELAERNLDAARKKFENGMTTSFEVNQIQRDLSQARTVEMLALAVYRKAVSAFHYATADILEWKGVQVEAAPDEIRSTANLRQEVN